MDDTEWTATGLFSPSKAKLAQAQARDWNFVDAWLSKKYVSSKVPAFERNEETLETLLALITLNDAADERRQVMEKVEKSALQYYARQKGDPGDTLYQSITDHLYQTGHDSVDTLAQASLLLNTPIKNGMTELSAAVTRMQMQMFESELVEKHDREQVAVLKAEHQRLMDLLARLKSNAYQAPDGLLEETAQWLKGAKHLRAKIGEYDERLAATRPNQPLLTLLEEMQKALIERKAQEALLIELEDDVQALKMLPAQSAAAQKSLDEVKEELAMLTLQRDELLKQQRG